MQSPSTEVADWLKAFEQAVREADYDAGCDLFSEDVVGFGTVSSRATGLDQLVRDQWRHIWGATEGFQFEHDLARSSESNGLAAVAVTWASTGFDSDGSPFERHGRSTIVLTRAGDEWRAVHTHFSLVPPSG